MTTLPADIQRIRELKRINKSIVDEVRLYGTPEQGSYGGEIVNRALALRAAKVSKKLQEQIDSYNEHLAAWHEKRKQLNARRLAGEQGTPNLDMTVADVDGYTNEILAERIELAKSYCQQIKGRRKLLDDILAELTPLHKQAESQAAHTEESTIATLKELGVPEGRIEKLGMGDFALNKYPIIQQARGNLAEIAESVRRITRYRDNIDSDVRVISAYVANTMIPQARHN